MYNNESIRVHLIEEMPRKKSHNWSPLLPSTDFYDFLFDTEIKEAMSINQFQKLLLLN